MNVLSLPPEVLETIFRWLLPKDITSLSMTCRLFNQVSRSDPLWTEVCYNEFGVKIPATEGFARKFYKNVLYQYRYLLGLWQMHADCYGGLMQVLLHIKYDDCKLCGVELRLPKEPHLTQPLRPKGIFSISLDDQDKAVIKCCINPQQQHGCSLHYGLKNIMPSGSVSLYLTRQCEDGVDGSAHQVHSDLGVELQSWLADLVDMTDEDAVFRTHSQFLYKYMVLRQMDLKTHFSRLTLPRPCDFAVPIQPGLFKGTYSAHGLELILLAYEDRNKVTGLKITGDPNVPAGQVTFRADLPFCMHVSEEEQNTLDRIEQMEPASSAVEWSEMPSPQPFRIPHGCEGRYHDVPPHCKARFHGFGQIARQGFQNSSFIEGHWVVFNEDLFGFLWIKLESFSLYHRVKERLV